MWCLLKATYIEHDQLVGRQIVKLQPGQFVFGRIVASEELSISQSTLWRYMQLLKSNNSLDIKTNNKYSVITVVNWESYQCDTKETDNNLDNSLENKRTTKEKQMDTNKKGNNVKKEKNIIIAQNKLGSFGNVCLSEEEYQRLKKDFDCADEAIEYLSGYIEEKGYKSKSHNLAIRRWVIDAVSKRKPKPFSFSDLCKEG